MSEQTKRISVTKLIETNFPEIHLEGEWKDCLGDGPQMSGIWIVWGHSGNGKTYGCLKLAKYLTKFAHVAYYDFEEGKRKTMKRAMLIMGMKDVARRFHFYGPMPFEDMKKSMHQRKSPRIVFLNSFQFVAFTKKQYQAFKQEFPNHLIILISHAEGKNPEGKVAKFVRYDADVKIWCEGFKFFNAGRYGGGKPVVIFPKKAAEYWNEQLADGE
jgi:hypothetical protein